MFSDSVALETSIPIADDLSLPQPCVRPSPKVQSLETSKAPVPEIPPGRGSGSSSPVVLAEKPQISAVPAVPSHANTPSSQPPGVGEATAGLSRTHALRHSGKNSRGKEVPMPVVPVLTGKNDGGSNSEKGTRGLVKTRSNSISHLLSADYLFSFLCTIFALIKI